MRAFGHIHRKRGSYARSYGERAAEVKPVKLPPRRPRFPVLTSGEELRRRFEERLKKREEEEQG